MCSNRGAFLEDVPDANFQSSSDHNPGYEPHYSRLSSTNNNVNGCNADASVAGQTAVGKWIQVDFSEQKKIEAVELRTRVGLAQYVSDRKSVV